MAWGDEMSGRSESGNLRNFGAMKEEKLIAVLYAVRAEDTDGEALEALEKEAMKRGLDIYADTETLVKRAIGRLETMRDVLFVEGYAKDDFNDVLLLLEAAVS